MPHHRPLLTLVLFYLLALAISWVFWAPLALARLGYLPEAPSFLHLLGSLGPALAALMVSRLPFSPVRTGMLAARLSPGLVPMTALIAAILLPLVIGLAGLLGQWLAMGERPPLEQALQTSRISVSVSRGMGRGQHRFLWLWRGDRLRADWPSRS